MNPRQSAFPSSLLLSLALQLFMHVIRLSPNTYPQKPAASGDHLQMHREMLLLCSKPHSPVRAPRPNDAQSPRWQSTWVRKYYKVENKRSLFHSTCHALQICFALKTEVKRFRSYTTSLFKNEPLTMDSQFGGGSLTVIDLITTS